MNDDGHPPQQHDISFDRLATHEEDKLQSNYEMIDAQYRNRMRQLNKGQISFLYHVLHHAKTSDEPTYYFLTSGAGVGKTFLLNMLYQSLLKFLNKAPRSDPSTLRILLLAPTGKAAYLLRGNTIHSALKFPINRSFEHKTLDADRLNSLRVQLRDVKLLISMVGVRLFNVIHKRLQEVFPSPKPFGGLSLILCGDLFQLKPVCDSMIFMPSKTGYGPLATNLWQENIIMYELQQIMRQDNISFALLLNRLREGKSTKEDINILHQRVIHTNTPCSVNVTCLFLTNKLVDEHNLALFLASEHMKITILAYDTVIGPMTQQHRLEILERIPSDPKKTSQLYGSLQLSVGFRYEISINHRTEDGLTNGAACDVKRIHVNGMKPSGVVWVHFLDVGQKTRQDCTKLVSYLIHGHHYSQSVDSLLLASQPRYCAHSLL